MSVLQITFTVMPRNIEILLEKQLRENDFENFVLTFAIQQGIVVPQKVLAEFGSRYGFDNFFTSIEHLEERRRELAELKKPENRFDAFSESEIEVQLNKLYEDELAKYLNNLYRYKEEIRNLRFIENKVKPIVPSNKLQEQFKKKILRFTEKEIKKCKKAYSKKLIKPEKIEREDYHKKFKTIKEVEYYTLKRHIKRIEKKLFVDPVFSEQLIEEWFELK